MHTKNNNKKILVSKALLNMMCDIKRLTTEMEQERKQKWQCVYMRAKEKIAPCIWRVMFSSIVMSKYHIFCALRWGNKIHISITFVAALVYAVLLLFLSPSLPAFIFLILLFITFYHVARNIIECTLFFQIFSLQFGGWTMYIVAMGAHTMWWK